MTNRKSVAYMAFALVLAAGTGQIAAAETPDPMEPVYTCRSISSDAERLACFDKAVADLFDKHQAGTVTTIDTAAIETLEREAFGFTMPSLPSLFARRGDGEPQRAGVDEVTEKVRSARIQNISKRVIVTLENGQVWEQIDTQRVSSSSLRRAQEARVRKAALGSFLMTIDGGVAFRVKRIS